MDNTTTGTLPLRVMQNRKWNPLIYGIFFFSGFSALIYQVLWVRILTITFGHTIYAVATVLTSFMAGLALGSWMAGKYADRTVRLVRLYGWLEVLIGVYGVIASWLFFHLNVIYSPLYNSIGSSFTLLVTTRFLLAFVLLLIPTTFMGATVPLLVKAITESITVLGEKSGRLYSVNTAGAVAGTLMAGFLLIPDYGLQKTNIIAVSINIIIGVVAIFLPFRAQGPGGIAAGISAGFPLTGVRRLVCLAGAVAGFIALSFEVVWTRSFLFAMFLGSSTYAFTTMLAAFLFGIAGGSYLCSFFIDRIKDRAFLFMIFQFVIGIVSVIAISMVIGGVLKPAKTTDFFSGALYDFLRAFLLMLLPTLMMGAVFPTLLRLGATDEQRLGTEVGRIYAFNTLGAIFGSFFAGFIFIPLLGISGTSVLLGILSLMLGLTIWYFINRPDRKKLTGWGIITVAIIVPAALWLPGYNFKRFFESMGHSICYYKEGNAATITMTEDKNGWKFFYVDNVFVQGSNNMLSMTDIKNLAHIPSLLHPNPKSVLTIGFGTGGTSYSFTRYPEYREINCVEIDLNVPRGSYCFPESNHGLLSHPDPRYRLIHDDARAFLENTNKSFDIITVDLADITYKSNSDVYTYEFINQCKKKLNPGGLNLIWVGVKSLSPANLKILIKTVLQVYGPPGVTVWHMTNFPNSDVLIVGVKDQPLKINLETMIRRMQQESVRQDLAEINMDDPYKLLTTFFVRGQALTDYVDNLPIHSIDKPILEFESPKDRFKEETMAQNIADLYWQIDNPFPPVETTDPEGFKKKFQTYLQARELYFQGEMATLRNKNLIFGSRYFANALALVPEDKSFLFCLGATDEQIRDYQTRLQKNPEDTETAYILALAYFLRNKLNQAEETLRKLENHKDPFFDYLSGRIAEKRGDFQQAKNFYLKFIPQATQSYQLEVDARIKNIDLTLANPVLTLEQKKQKTDWLLQAGEFEQAVRVAEDLMTESKTIDDQLWYAGVMRQAGYLDRAIAAYKTVLQQQPERGEAWYYMGDIYLQLREVAQAKTALEKALSIDRLNPSIYYALARYYEIIDVKEEASKFLTQAINLGGSPIQQIAMGDPLFSYRFGRR